MAYSIKETKEAVKFVIELAEAVDASLADGKIGFEDIGHFVTALMGAGNAFGDMNLIPKELGDLDEAEAAELHAYIKAEFDIANDKIEKIVEVSLYVLVKVYEVIQMLKSDDEEKAEEAAPAQ